MLMFNKFKVTKWAPIPSNINLKYFQSLLQFFKLKRYWGEFLICSWITVFFVYLCVKSNRASRSEIYLKINLIEYIYGFLISLNMILFKNILIVHDILCFSILHGLPQYILCEVRQTLKRVKIPEKEIKMGGRAPGGSKIF